jgi:hypothetical protein
MSTRKSVRKRSDDLRREYDFSALIPSLLTNWGEVKAPKS